MDAARFGYVTSEENGGWGARIRTWECRYQKPMPYRLATPQQDLGDTVALQIAA